MDEWFRVLILSIVQGIGEFLPISSSGHLLVLDRFLFGIGESESEILALGILLHAGTLLSILFYFQGEIFSLFGRNRYLIPLLIIGSIPASVVGFLVLKKYAFLEYSLPITGMGFLTTAILLLITVRKRKKGSACSLKNIRYRDALTIGIFQAFAVLPGFSRSGFTFCGGLVCGLDREASAVFSFLLAIPILSGAIFLECCQIYQTGENADRIGLYCMGGTISFLVGLWALAWFMKWIKIDRFERFAWWLIPMGILVLSGSLL